MEDHNLDPTTNELLVESKNRFAQAFHAFVAGVAYLAAAAFSAVEERV